MRLSAILSTYLALTILLDIATVRSLLRRPGLHGEGYVLISTLVLRFCLLFLEEIPKRKLFYQGSDRDATSREAGSGFWNRRLFIWLNSTLIAGFRSILLVDNLQNIGSDFESNALLTRVDKAWETGRLAVYIAFWPLLRKLTQPIRTPIMPSSKRQRRFSHVRCWPLSCLGLCFPLLPCRNHFFYAGLSKLLVIQIYRPTLQMDSSGLLCLSTWGSEYVILLPDPYAN